MSRHEVDRFMALEQAVEDAWLKVLDGPWAPEATALELEDMRLAAVELAVAVTMLLEARDRPPLKVVERNSAA